MTQSRRSIEQQLANLPPTGPRPALLRPAVGKIVGAGVALGLVVALVGGCGEMITYSKDSRKAGQASLQAGQLNDAAGAFRDAIRQNPRDFRSYRYLAQTYHKLGQDGEAVLNYKLSLQTQALSDAGKDDKAFRQETIEQLASLLAQSDPQDIEINRLQSEAATDTDGEKYYILARTFAHRGDPDTALSMYAQAMQQNPASAPIARDYGLYLEQLGQRDAAVPVLEQAYRLDPANTQIDAALRRVGIIPGPSLMDENQLAKPLIPTGPLPAVPLPGRTPPPLPLPPG